MRATLSVLCGVLVGAGVAVLSFFVVMWLLMVCMDSGTNLDSAITSLHFAGPFGIGCAICIGLAAGKLAGAWIFREPSSRLTTRDTI
jgi:hypothetical protein